MSAKRPLNRMPVLEDLSQMPSLKDVLANAEDTAYDYSAKDPKLFEEQKLKEQIATSLKQIWVNCGYKGEELFVNYQS